MSSKNEPQIQKFYACIDLKSFYASVECVERGLDPMTTDLVVADESRGRGSICLAVTPSLKAKGIKNRCRLFEVPEKWGVIIAKPRMKLYMLYSAKIYGIYLQYISEQDIHPYSIDECFFDLTPYLNYYKMSPKEISIMLMDAVLKKYGIRATAGIGTNLFLAKVALDITAKKASDFIGYLDESLFKEELWHHTPIEDIWNIGPGTAKRLSKYGIYDLFGVAHCQKEIILKEFGKLGIFLIDHSWGCEPCTISEIKAYQPQHQSFSNSQILFEDYEYEDAKIILNEMVEGLSDRLVRQDCVTGEISIHVGYSRNAQVKSTSGSCILPYKTQSFRFLLPVFENIYERTVHHDVPIRRIGISMGDITPDNQVQTTLFDYFISNQGSKDLSLQKTIVTLRNRYGNTSVFRGINQLEKSTALERAKYVGGHHG